MESSYDLAYVISRGIILLGCVAAAVLAARSPRVRPLAWLGVATMVASLLMGALPTMGLSPSLDGAGHLDGHSVWHGWSAVFLGIGAGIYIVAIAMGQRLRDRYSGETS